MGQIIGASYGSKLWWQINGANFGSTLWELFMGANYSSNSVGSNCGLELYVCIPASNLSIKLFSNNLRLKLLSRTFDLHCVLAFWVRVVGLSWGLELWA